MSPTTIFQVANGIALLCWIALAATLFVPAMRRPGWLVTSLAVPGLLAVAYILLIASAWGVEGGGFGSIGEVRALFANDAALTAGWLHYLAFDLFVGTWIARDGIERGVPRLALLACLPLTFMFGPAGLLLAILVRPLGRKAT